jgi:2-oxoglutarate dehydrogenase E2 component (dihydrolipoamide succinyltransferase)
MPQLGETVTEGTITRWAKQVGEPVAEDEVLFEVSTDKVDSEVPSPVAGVLTEILVPEGDTVDVGTKLAVISDAAAGTTSEASPSATAEAEPAADAEPAPDAEPVGEAEPEPDPEATPEAEPAPVASTPSAPTPVAALANPPAAVTARVSEPAGPVSEPRGRSDGSDAGRVLSPVVRRLISEHHLDPTQIEGTGAGGRITRSDVLALIDRRNGGVAPSRQPAATPAPSGREPSAAAPAAPAPPAPVPAEQRAPGPPSAPAAGGERDTVVPFTNIRRRTAEHMVRSKHTSAHTMVAVEVDYAAVDRVRQPAREKFRAAEGFSLTYLPFITRAVVDSLADFPHVNSSVGDDALIVHHDLNIGIAVDLDFEGLLVPVIHQADTKRLRALAREISGLAGKARAKRLTMDDISGGTFTITNAGPFGTFITVPVINQPQVAILSTDGVRKRPVVVELPDGSDGIAVHPVGNLVLSWDHRAFDGAYAAAFVGAVRDVIETRDWSSEL